MTRAAPTASLTFGGAAPDRARSGLVLLHGRGGSARDIMGLGDALDLKDIAMTAPTAKGNSWWPTSFLAPTAEMEPYVEAGFSTVDAAIGALEDGGLAREKIILAGFSQGGCLALEYAARHGGLKAVFGFSAALIGTKDGEGPATEALYGHMPKQFGYTARLDGLIAYVSVHQQDPHIPLARAQHSADVLRELGAEVKLGVTPGQGHGITEGNMSALRTVFTD